MKAVEAIFHNENLQVTEIFVRRKGKWFCPLENAYEHAFSMWPVEAAVKQAMGKCQGWESLSFEILHLILPLGRVNMGQISL